MIGFVILNCCLSLVLAVMITFSIAWFEHWLSRVERLGLGIMGGSALLRIPVIYFTSKNITTPYDGWGTCLFTGGTIIFMAGWMYRKRKHDLANARQNKAAFRHLKERGKL